MTDLKAIHWMVDLYGAVRERAENTEDILGLLMWANRELFKNEGTMQLTPVLGNTKNPQDNGISGIVNAPFGHFTIHTFSQRGVTFVDLFEEDDNEALQRNRRSMLLSALKQHLGYISCDWRDQYVKKGFGEHVILQCDYVSLTRAIKIVEQIVSTIDMKPLAPEIITLKGEDYDLIQPIVTSHIAFHSQVATNRTMIDIFSCKPFSWDKLREVLDVWGVRSHETLRVSRGIK